MKFRNQKAGGGAKNKTKQKVITTAEQKLSCAGLLIIFFKYIV